MSYKPKYCCQCGEKIDKVDRKFWESPRFCELCATEFGIYDLARRGLVGLGLLFGLLGLGFFLAKPAKTPIIAPNQFVVGNSNGKGEIADQKIASPSGGDVQTKTSIANSVAQLKTQGAPSPTETKKSRIENASGDVSETVYFCGAETKKGTLCSRRVKGGGRCWQHAGQPAMLPQAELIAAR